MSQQNSSPNMQNTQPSRHGLFRRIYFTYLLSTLVFAVVAIVVIFWSFNRYGPGWVDEVVETLGEQNDALVEELDQPSRLQKRLQTLESQLHAQIALMPSDQKSWNALQARRFGQARLARMFARLRRGQPVVLRRRWDEPPGVYFGIQDQQQRLVAIVFVDAQKPANLRWLITLGGIALLFVILAIAARQLARSFTRRLHALEASTIRIAHGDFTHRAKVPPIGPRDEIDQLSTTFNGMAQQLEHLMNGQRMLLANASHELRTPVARMRVLVELLSEQVDGEASVNSRLATGIQELTEDISELEQLINDLLVSAKLEFTPGNRHDFQEIACLPLLERVAAPYAARVHCQPADATLVGDPVLLERMLINVLSNAQRACPQGPIELALTQEQNRIKIAIEDHGPGIRPSDRESIFDPFFRLDHARARDAGGAGLGLYLCRQIAKIHGGTIHVENRLDGHVGARFVIVLADQREQKL